MIILILVAFSGSASADLMNLNVGMPTRLEDATPVDEYDFDFQTTMSRDGESPETYLSPNMRYGLTERIQLEAIWEVASGGDESESGAVDLDVLWLVTGDDAHTAIALNPSVFLPTGKRTAGTDTAMKVDVTRTLLGTIDNPTTEAHLNLQCRFNDERASNERAQSWSHALGLSQLLGETTSMVVDYYAEEETEEGPLKRWLEAGIQQSLGKEFYVAVGVNRSVGKDSRATGWTAALEKQF